MLLAFTPAPSKKGHFWRRRQQGQGKHVKTSISLTYIAFKEQDHVQRCVLIVQNRDE